MERAATGCFYWLIRNIPHGKTVKVFCGTGNNGGDGLAISRMLSAKGYPVEIFLLGSVDQLSESCRINYERALALPGIKLRFLLEGESLPDIDRERDTVLDSIFGSGLTRPVTGFFAKVIGHLNDKKHVFVSIDVPSGLFCDTSVTGSKKPVVVQADFTLTFSPPKLAFFFQENDKYIGRWHLLDIGIMQEFIDHAGTKNFYTDQEDCKKILKPRNTYSHKGTFGHALLFCGSRGKMGAAVLASRGCLRSGPGLVTAHVPRFGSAILQTTVPEAMLDIDSSDDILTEIPDLSRFTSIAAGPGIGQEDQTQRMLKLLIQNSTIPLIFDADAINILGENKTWISFVPKGSIFTPHPKEFERLVGKSSDDFERNKIQRDFSIKYGVYVILKGAHTAITTPDGKCYFNSTGNPGMATGGSGDVLTGILAGLKAQGYTSLETCLLGVYLHGLAGDHAAESFGQEAMIAGDIITHLGKAFQSIYL
jgi:NAD(P)H-hydrate epimerase